MINLKFEDYISKRLKDNEEVVKVFREYILVNTWAIMITAILVIVPFFLMFPLFRLGWYGILIFLLLVIAGLIFGFRKYIMWYYTTFVITNQRIIDYDQKGLFHRQVSEAVFEKIQDVSYNKKGPTQTLFNYGNIVVQTAGEAKNLEINKVKNPSKVQSLLVELQYNIINKSAEDQELSAKELLDMVNRIKNDLTSSKKGDKDGKDEKNP